MLMTDISSMENLVFYAFCLLIIIVGIALIKKFVGCLLRSVILLIIIAVLAYAYFNYYV